VVEEVDREMNESLEDEESTLAHLMEPRFLEEFLAIMFTCVKNKVSNFLFARVEMRFE